MLQLVLIKKTLHYIELGCFNEGLCAQNRRLRAAVGGCSDRRTGMLTDIDSESFPALVGSLFPQAVRLRWESQLDRIMIDIEMDHEYILSCL